MCVTDASSKKAVFQNKAKNIIFTKIVMHSQTESQNLIKPTNSLFCCFYVTKN